ncbi:MAG: carboxypeptidase-like regulatory domain-containing protein [Gemmatimonadaceae bacterium]
MKALTVLKGLLALPLAATALAQQPPTTASVFGTAYDSVRFRPMAGARVRVDTSDLVGVADDHGRWQIAGVPPGEHYLRVEHPILDSLGVTLRTARIMFLAGNGTIHELATPTSTVLIERLCTPAWRARGPAALMGRVREADTQAPAVGARVSLVWYEVEIANPTKPVPRVREVQVGQDGTYRICGLPAQLDGKVQVIRGNLTSGDIPMNFGEDLLGVRSMSIAAPGAVVAVTTDASDSTLARAPETTLVGNARLTGQVRNKAGAPLVGARVMLEGTARAASTRTDGGFVLDSLPPGTQSVAVRMLGYAPTEAAVELSSAASRRVVITMEDFVPTLETVRVSAQRDRALENIGYARRKRLGSGYYLEGTEINRESLHFSDVLRNVPGIRIVPGGGGQYIQSARGPMTCVSIWIDGTQWQQIEPGDIDDYLKPNEVGAIEVYSPSSTPMEFQGRGGSCTTIVAWTARRLSPRR